MAGIIRYMAEDTIQSRTSFGEICWLVLKELARPAVYAIAMGVATAVGAVGWTVAGRPAAAPSDSTALGIGILGTAGMGIGVIAAFWFGFREMRKADQARAAKVDL